MIRKIAITGPESTGKSVLSEQLALHYDTVYVPEFARTYLSAMSRIYEMEDVIRIAKGQIESEQHWMDAARDFLFCDTDLINIKIWLEFKFGHCPQWIVDKIEANPYDLYLLTDIDLPWIADALRENPDKQAYFFEMFQNELKAIDADFHIISGQEESRLKRAIHVIEHSFPDVR